MRKFTITLLALAAFVAALAATSTANDGKVTFVNDAQKAGKVHATIYYTSPNNSCKVTSAVTHAKGTAAADKAAQLAADINAQCVNVTATAAGGTVTVSSAGSKTITEIDISDGTGQTKTINPKDVNDDKKYYTISIEGTGIDGFAYLTMDDCGASCTTSTAGKNGAQIAADLVAGLPNCDSANGSTIKAVYIGTIGLIRIRGLSNDNSTITFNPGDTALTDVIQVTTDPPSLPSLTNWGLILLLALLIASAAYIVYRRQGVTVS